MSKKENQNKKTVDFTDEQWVEVGKIMRALHIDHFAELMAKSDWTPEKIREKTPTQKAAMDKVLVDGLPRVVTAHWNKTAVSKRIKLLEAAVDQLKEEMKSLEQ